MSMQIELFGVRGSLPYAVGPREQADHVRRLFQLFRESQFTKVETDLFLNSLPTHLLNGYGGNTTCVRVTTPQADLIIDGGSGIRQLGDQLMAGPCSKGKGVVHIFMTHFHWDHLIGLPFFTPIFIPGNQIHFYAVQEDLEDNIRSVFKKPFFPVGFEHLGASIHFHRLTPHKPFVISDLQVTPYQLDHPDPCWGYKMENNGRVFSFCVDTECTRVSPAEMGIDLPFYQGVDLMIFDAQYTLEEVTHRINWGHAVATIGLDIAMREQVKRIVFVHHDPRASSEKIFSAEEQTRAYFESQKTFALRSNQTFNNVDWAFGYEGMRIVV